MEKYQQGRIQSQVDVIKCRQCWKNSSSKTQLQFFYCCEPFQVQKILCTNCVRQDKCTHCNGKKAQKKIDLKELDNNFLIKLQQNKNPSQIKSFIGEQVKQSNCCLCLRNFSSFRFQSFKHQGCKNNMCSACLYLTYKSQSKMFSQDDQKTKEKYKLVMSCCKGLGFTIDAYEKMFRNQLCVLCGISSKQQKCMFEFQGRFKCCRKCFVNMVDNGSKNKPKSIDYLFKEINKIIPKECLFCESPLQITKCKSDEDVFGFNKKLCPKCFAQNKYKTAIELLENYTTTNASQLCKDQKDFNLYSCCQKQCSRGMNVTMCQVKKSTEINTVIQLDLIIWRNDKTYCGVCLYFKYQKIRQKFVQNLQQFLLQQTQINEFHAIQISYQRHFDQHCMICSNPPTKQNPQKYLVEKNNQIYKLDQDQHKISCQYCQKCLLILFLPHGDKQYNQIKQQMIRRNNQMETIFSNKFKKQKYYLFQKQARYKSQEFIKFWPICQNKEYNKKSTVNKKYLSLASSESNKSLTQKQQEQNQQNHNVNQRKDSQQSTFDQFKKQKNNQPPQKNSNQTNYNNLLSWQKPQAKRSKFDQPEPQYQINKDQNKQKPKNNNSDNEKILFKDKDQEFKILDLDDYKPNIILKFCIQTFQTQQEDKKNNNEINLKDNKKHDQDIDNDNTDQLKKIRDYFLDQQVLNQINSVPYEELWNKFINYEPLLRCQNLKDENEQIKERNIQEGIKQQKTYKMRQEEKVLFDSKKLIKSVNSVLKEQSKMMYCKIKGCESNVKRQNSRKISQSSNKYICEQIDNNEMRYLNLGLMCDRCYIKYLMGLLDLKSEVDRDMLLKQKESSMRWIQMLEEEYEVKDNSVIEENKNIREGKNRKVIRSK